jgi:NAD(P)-dependent dehydrogenase (short-subunit alcohol dehydrogenase family)
MIDCHLLTFIGANRGIGLALVKEFLGDGYRVWGTVRPRTLKDSSTDDVSQNLPVCTAP